MTGASRRYAEAVFEIARSDGTFDEWARDLDSIASLVEDPKIGPVLLSPAVDSSVQRRLVGELLKNAGEKARNLALLLLARNRLPISRRLSDNYLDLVDRHRGIALAEVTSAVPLDAGEQEMVSRKLSQMTGRQVKLRMQVDPEIIGGVVARVGDLLIDASVKGRLEMLKRRLASV